jgi:hypothetical protein
MINLNNVLRKGDQMLTVNDLLKIKTEEFSSRVMELNKNLDSEKQNALFECIRRQALIESGAEKRIDVSKPKISLETMNKINSLTKELKETREIYEALLAFQSKNKPQMLDQLERQWLEEINKISAW